MNQPPAAFARLLVLTDRAQLPPGRDLVSTIGACLQAGLHTVILRELDLARPERAALAAELSALGARVIAAHDPLPSCVGVHVSAGAPAGSGIWGRSCHSAEEVAVAADEGALWATLSPFEETASKPCYGPAVDRATYAGPPIPTYALGGMTPANASEAIAAGAHGVAVMGAVMRADDPTQVVEDFLAVLP